MSEETLIEFPCHFPVKIIGINSDVFLKEILVILEEQFPDPGHRSVKHNKSKDGNYLAITVTIYVEDKTTLDSFYKAVTKHPDIKMVL